MGIVDYLPGASKEGDESVVLKASFTFMGLQPHMAYTVVVRAAISEDQNTFDGIRLFITNVAGIVSVCRIVRKGIQMTGCPCSC